MENKSAQAAQEQLAILSASRELALERIVLPWWHVVGLAVAMNGCLLTVVLPIVLSDSWTLLIQGAFTAALLVLVLKQRGSKGVKRPRLRVQGAWVLTVICSVGFGAALAVAIYARTQEDPWLGGAALLINFASYLVVYGGLGFLLRRQFARLA
jgi:hypothetical protein